MTNFSVPQATVIIPAYNAAHTIGQQLQALRDQVDAPDFEILIADNGSTDNLAAAVKPFVERLNVKIIDASAKKGQSYARNLAVARAQTNYILACDADDIVSPYWVAKIYQHILKQDCIVATPIVPFYPHRGEDKPEQYLERATTEPLMGLKHQHFAQSGSTGYRRSSFIEVGGMDETYQGGSEDIDFSWRLTETGRPLIWEPEAILFNRSRGDDTAVFKQVYRYARENVLLWKRAKDRGVTINSVSFKVAIIRALAVPRLYLKSRDWEQVAGYGGRVGALSGNIQYRLLKKKKNPIFMQDSIPGLKS